MVLALIIKILIAPDKPCDIIITKTDDFFSLEI
jgi:hypothetical protein